MMDVSLFRTNFPEFSDTVIYSSSMISFWATLAEMQVLVDVWCNAQPMGVQLFVAHQLVVASQNVKAAKFGGTPGVSGGIAASKSVGGASVSYDSGSTAEEGAGFWNRSTYGQQFWRMARMFGTKAIQL